MVAHHASRSAPTDRLKDPTFSAYLLPAKGQR